MIISRDRYLQKIITKKWNGKIKVITGIRRCGKSYLLNNLFVDHLVREGVKSADIIILALDEIHSKMILKERGNISNQRRLK